MKKIIKIEKFNKNSEVILLACSLCHCECDTKLLEDSSFCLKSKKIQGLLKSKFLEKEFSTQMCAKGYYKIFNTKTLEGYCK